MEPTNWDGMNTKEATTWHQLNQRQLLAALAQVRRSLERHAGYIERTPAARGGPAAYYERLGLSPKRQAGATASPTPPPAAVQQPPPAPNDTRDAALAMSPSALEVLCQRLDLSTFERDVLLLCAGMELDATFPTLCAAIHGDALRSYPTFGLAQTTLPDAHWSAVAPSGPLRQWRLIEVGAGNATTISPLRIDERVLQYLIGTTMVDERLISFIEPFQGSIDLVPSQEALARQIVAVWQQASAEERFPIVQLCGPEGASRRGIAAAACHLLDLKLYVLPAQIVPADPRELATFSRLWMREALLEGSILLVDCGDLDPSDAVREQVIVRLIERLETPLLVAGRERRTTPHRTMITLDVPRPSMAEQRTLWWHTLGSVQPYVNGGVDAVVSQFSLSPAAIEAACTAALIQATETDDNEEEALEKLDGLLWEACRKQSRPQMEHLAQRIEPRATWSDLILPEAQVAILREVSAHVRGRMTVYETWGLAGKSSRGLGISAMFVGVSGTGKTMAAEVLANELDLDLYRIDLSQVVNKYIGETEKNLRRVFDAAEGSGAIILFDEADALFGKRSEVKDSHDRYANIEISYLLQRMEEYRGLAILTTNMRDALDVAFLRRIRFVVQFPVPDAHQRAQIWGRMFPTAMPINGVDVHKLARLNVPGGNIRNIAMNAAFLAAAAGEPVQMTHLLQAARREYAKMEKHLTDAEVKGWV